MINVSPGPHSAMGSRSIPALGPGRLAGWLDLEQLRPSFSIESQEAQGELHLLAPGFELRCSTQQVHVHVGQSSVVAVVGEPLMNGVKVQTADLAERISRNSEAWSRIGGRFAVIHADLKNEVVSLATDRFGVWPLCWAREGQRLAFADRADQVPCAIQPELDAQAIFDYVYFHAIPAPRTIFSGVQRIEAATLLQSAKEGVRSSRLWTPHFAGHDRAAGSELANRFRQLVSNAVDLEAGDGAVGCFLSGGTDSSTVAGTLAKLRGGVDTFSIGFDAAGYDEMHYARVASNHFRTRHHEHYVTPAELVTSIPRVAVHYDQPFGNSSAVPAYVCAQVARNTGVRKLLAGDGGDELFGGNSRYAKQKVFEAWWAVPAPIRKTAHALLLNDIARALPVARKAASYVEQAEVPMPARTETYNLLARFGTANVFTQAFLDRIDATAPARLQSAIYAESEAATFVDRMLAFDWRFTLADNDLPKVTGTTHLAGVLVGFPLLDDALVDLSTELSARDKVHGLKLRHFFKEALADFLPAEILAKKKHGFGLPVGPWLVSHKELRKLARDSLDALVERGLILPALVEDLFSRRLEQHAGYYGEMAWVLMMLEKWLSGRRANWSIR